MGDETIVKTKHFTKDDLKREARDILTDLRRNDWHSLRDNKLREIKHTTDRWINSLNLTREQYVILTRLRIGHTWHTHRHLIEKKET